MILTKGDTQVAFLQEQISRSARVVKANFVIERGLTSTAASFLLTLQEKEQQTFHEFQWTPELEEYLLIKAPIRMHTREEEVARFANILANNLRNAEREFGEELAQAVFIRVLRQKPQYQLDDILEKISPSIPKPGNKLLEQCREYLESSIQGLSNTLVWCLGYPNDPTTAQVLGDSLKSVIDNEFNISLRESLFKGKQEGAYFELQSWVRASLLNVSNVKLIEAMRKSSIQAFGWPIGVVMDNEQYRPRSRDKAIEAVIETAESFDTWTLTSSGDFYLLKSLFEEKRDRTAIFIDVRLIRMLESFARIAALYRELGSPQGVTVRIHLKYSGLYKRTLKIASQNRFLSHFHQRVSLADTFSRVHEARLSELLQISFLEDLVIEDGRELAQLFDAFVLSEESARAMLREHRAYKEIVQILAKGTPEYPLT